MAQKYRFSCPACGEEVLVDRPLREELLRRGCVVCAASVGPHCFDPA